MGSPKKLADVKVVTGVIGSDAHVMGNWIVQQALKKVGLQVIALGPMVSQEEFIDAAIEAEADAIFVSSLYGHGVIDCDGLREKCNEAGLDHILLYVGGFLVIGKQEWPPIEKKYLEMGFNRVYPPNTLPEVAINDLIKDLGVSE